MTLAASDCGTSSDHNAGVRPTDVNEPHIVSKPDQYLVPAPTLESKPGRGISKSTTVTYSNLLPMATPRVVTATKTKASPSKLTSTLSAIPTYNPTSLPTIILTKVPEASVTPLPVYTYTATTIPVPTLSATPQSLPTATPTVIATATLTASPTATPAAMISVEVKNYAFVPMTVTVNVGKPVTWNFVQGTHTSTGSGSESWDSWNKNGGSFSHTFNRTGMFSYVCKLHSFMTGTVVVE